MIALPGYGLAAQDEALRSATGQEMGQRSTAKTNAKPGTATASPAAALRAAPAASPAVSPTAALRAAPGARTPKPRATTRAGSVPADVDMDWPAALTQANP